MLQEVSIDDASGDAHAGVAHRQIALAPHRGHSLGGTGETQYLLCYVGWDAVVVQILHIVSVNAEGWQTFLCMGSQDGGQIDGSWTFCAVESPHGLGVVRIHVHRLRTVAPARSHRDGRTHAFSLELLSTGGTLSHTANRRVADDTLHRRTVAIAQVVGD